MKYWELFPQVNSVVIPVNCKGVMGAGLAKAIKPHLPDEEWRYYRLLCETAKPGDVEFGISFRWIYAFTKDHWKNNTKLDWVERILQGLILMGVRDQTLLLPYLGCGLGGLKVEQVQKLYDHYIPLMSWKEVYVV